MIRGRKISEKIELIKGVGENLPIKNGCVQLCLMTATLDHAKDPNRIIKEVYRVLDDGGGFMLLQSTVRKKEAVFNDLMHLHDFTMVELKRLLKDFRVEKIRSFFCIPLPDELLGNYRTYKILTKIYGLIAPYFQNYSVAIIKMRRK